VGRGGEALFHRMAVDDENAHPPICVRPAA
jgi:hypothetical protein